MIRPFGIRLGRCPYTARRIKVPQLPVPGQLVVSYIPSSRLKCEMADNGTPKNFEISIFFLEILEVAAALPLSANTCSSLESTHLTCSFQICLF